MKIVEVISSLESRGGAEVFLLSLISNFPKDSQITLISLYGSVDQTFQKYIESNHITYKCCYKKGKFDLKASNRLKKIINEIKPDIVNFHLSFLFTYTLAFGFKKQPFKLVETFHSVPGDDLSARDNQLRRKLIKNDAISFIAISNIICRQAKDFFGENIIITTINNGIELPILSDNHEKKEFDFVCVANMLPVKNHYLLLDAYVDVIKKYPNTKMVLVGGGPLLDSVRQRSNELGINNNIEILGFVPNASEYLLKSKVFVLSSVREGNPISILEALAFGLPVIASKVGGIPDVIKDGENGFLFESNDKEHLSTLMCKLLTDNDLCSKISSSNVVRSKEYSIAMTVTEYEKLFKELLNN